MFSECYLNSIAARDRCHCMGLSLFPSTRTHTHAQEIKAKERERERSDIEILCSKCDLLHTYWGQETFVGMEERRRLQAEYFLSFEKPSSIKVSTCQFEVDATLRPVAEKRSCSHSPYIASVSYFLLGLRKVIHTKAVEQ